MLGGLPLDEPPTFQSSLTWDNWKALLVEVNVLNLRVGECVRNGQHGDGGQKRKASGNPVSVFDGDELAEAGERSADNCDDELGVLLNVGNHGVPSTRDLYQFYHRPCIARSAFCFLEFC